MCSELQHAGRDKRMHSHTPFARNRYSSNSLDEVSGASRITTNPMA